MAQKFRNDGAVESGAVAASYTDQTGAYMDYDPVGLYAQFGAKASAGGSVGLKLRTILAGVATTVLTFTAAGAVTFAGAATMQELTATTANFSGAITATTGGNHLFGRAGGSTILTADNSGDATFYHGLLFVTNATDRTVKAALADRSWIFDLGGRASDGTSLPTAWADRLNIGTVAGGTQLGANNVTTLLSLTTAGALTLAAGLTATAGIFVTGSGSPLTVEHSGVASALRVGISMKRGGVQRYVLGFNASDEMSILDAAGSTELFKLSNAGAGTFTAGLTATAVTIDQGAADGEILTLRSSDVAHGMTVLTDTSTFGFFQKYTSTEGGVRLEGYSEGSVGNLFVGNITTGTSVRSVAAVAHVMIDSYLKSGTGRVVPSTDTNILAVAAGGSVRHILDSDGDSHQDVGTAWTNFDAHDDVALLNLLAAKVTRRDDPLRQEFGKWLTKNRDPLTRMKLVTFNDDGHPFVNMSRLTMLHTGAIRQIGSKQERLESALRHVVDLNPQLVGREQALALLN